MHEIIYEIVILQIFVCGGVTPYILHPVGPTVPNDATSNLICS